MRGRRMAMTIEEYHLLPFEPGWKCEYRDGCAHYSPRYHAVHTTLAIAPRRINAPCQLRPAIESDAGALVPSYMAAFGETVEYFGYSPQKTAEAARRTLRSHFAGERGKPHPASAVAVDLNPNSKQEVPIGAALVVERKSGLLLDLLFVTPTWQRHGVARALISAVVNELHLSGEQTLTSRYHIGNERSLAWHQSCGFVEEPDLMRARLYYRAADHELWRREQMGNLTPEERERLNSEFQSWKSEVEKLERLEHEEGFEAVHPMSRW